MVRRRRISLRPSHMLDMAVRLAWTTVLACGQTRSKYRRALDRLDSAVFRLFCSGRKAEGRKKRVQESIRHHFAKISWADRGAALEVVDAQLLSGK